MINLDDEFIFLILMQMNSNGNDNNVMNDSVEEILNAEDIASFLDIDDTFASQSPRSGSNTE